MTTMAILAVLLGTILTFVITRRTTWRRERERIYGTPHHPLAVIKVEKEEEELDEELEEEEEEDE